MLFEHSEKRLSDRLRFEAAIHGAKLDEPAPGPKDKAPRTDKKCQSGDPDSYSHLSMEEREELTRKMMNKHKIWAKESKPMGGKKARMG